MAEYNKVYASLKPELPKVIQQEQIYVYIPKTYSLDWSEIESIESINGNSDRSVHYDSVNKARFSGVTRINTKSINGESHTFSVPTTFTLAIEGGYCVNVDANERASAVRISIDSDDLAKDFYKINKTSTTSVVPAYTPTKGRTDVIYTFADVGKTLALRGADGEAKFNWILANQWKKVDSAFTIDFNDTVKQLVSGRLVVDKTASDTGTLSVAQLEGLQRLPQYQLQYDKQTYYRMDPMNAPDGTLNYIHIDSVQDGNSGYKATGKCFSITVRTRAWQVLDINFGGNGYIPVSKGTGTNSLVCNSENIATGDFAMAVNGGTFSYKNIVVNAKTEARGTSSYASGQGTKTATTENGSDNGVGAHAEGSIAATSTMPAGYENRYDFIQDSYYISTNYAGGRGSHVEGCGTKVQDGKTAGHAEGYRTVVDSNNAHAEGFYTTVAGENGHAEGAYTRVYGKHSHAEGYMTNAISDRSHAEGRECEAHGANSHAEGYATKTKHNGAHTEGNNTVSGDSYQHTAGRYNEQFVGARVTGGGTADNARKNIEILDWDGNLKLAGSITLNMNGSAANLTAEQLMQLHESNDIVITKTASNTGTLDTSTLTILQSYPQVHISYDNQIYYRQDPVSAPYGTLSYVHLDSVQAGGGSYKATGKCFSITVSTREWKVFDLDFGGSTPASQATEIYRHGITMNDADIVVKLDIYDSNSQNYTYEQLKAKLSTSTSYCANARIKRSDSTYYYSPATIAYWNDSTGDFALTYNNTEGNNINVNWTPSVVSDNGTQIL